MELRGLEPLTLTLPGNPASLACGNTRGTRKPAQLTTVQRSYVQLHDVQLLALLQFHSKTSSVRLARSNTWCLHHKGYGASHQNGHFITQDYSRRHQGATASAAFPPTGQTALINDLSRDVIVLTDQGGSARTCPCADVATITMQLVNQ